MEDCPRIYYYYPVIAGILTVVWIAPPLFLDETTWRSVASPLYRRDYSLSGIDISIVSERTCTDSPILVYLGGDCII
jgi:hypothetical protein